MPTGTSWSDDGRQHGGPERAGAFLVRGRSGFFDTVRTDGNRGIGEAPANGMRWAVFEGNTEPPSTALTARR